MAAYQKRYNPDRSADWNYGGSHWKLSRSKIELFVECPRCFYLDNKLGTARPRGPAFTLNVAVDALLKKEFDAYRKKKQPHPFMVENAVDAIPFAHEKLDLWRDTFEGITYFDEATGFTISGAVDDLWVTKKGELIVVDYKATSKDTDIKDLSDTSWEDSYRRQMGVYQWLLQKNGFTVSPRGYFVYANADTSHAAFNETLQFKISLVPCEGETEWIDETLPRIKTCLESDAIPEKGAYCEYCAYREAAGKKLLSLKKAELKRAHGSAH